MKRIATTFTLALALLVVLPSCEKVFDDFLAEPTLEGQTTIEDYWIAVAEMDKLMNGAYAVTLGFNGNGLGSAPWTIANCMGDFLAPYEVNYALFEKSLGNQFYRRRNNINNWDDHTRILQYASNGENIANSIIEKLESGDYDDDPDFEILGKQMLGESYAMRAVINFQYTKQFGKQYHSSTRDELAWLYRREPIKAVEDGFKKRETVGDSYAYLLEDCEKAIEFLPEEYDPEIHKTTYGTNRFHADFARALKAEVLFQMNDFENVVPAVNDLLGGEAGSSPRYPLARFVEDDEWSGFPAEIYYRYENEWYGPSRGLEVIFSWAADCGTHPTRADKNQRHGLFVPPIVDANQSRADFVVNGNQGIYRMSQHFIDYVDFDEANDLRFKELIDVIVSSEDGNTYWWPLKYQKVSNSANGPNILWFRSATFMLMRAEANARLGNNAAAIADLDAIRERAGLGSYAGSSDDSGNLVQDIIKERAREMFLEKYRIWEQLRLGAVDGTKIGIGDRANVPTFNPGFDLLHTGSDPIDWDSDIWPFAIPTNESLYNPDVLL